MRWQHRTCGTGVTRMEYRTAIKEGCDIDWSCTFCSTVDTSATPTSPCMTLMDTDAAPADDPAFSATPTEAEGYSAPGASGTCFEDENMVLSDISTGSSCLTSLDTDAAPADDPTDVAPADDPIDVAPADDPTTSSDSITYEKVLSSTQRGQHKLVDSVGYTYTVKRKTRVGVHWRCAVRNKNVKCRATVKETNVMYIKDHNPHSHPPETCSAITSKVSALVKEKALQDVFRSAADIVDEVLRDEVDPHVPLSSLPAPENLARQGNRKRRAARPPEPLDLTFE